MELFIDRAQQFIVFISDKVPLELFVFVGALLEEIIAPIPSMLVMTTAGLLSHAEGHTVFFLFWLVFIGNLGKILGSLGWYVVGDKIEDVVVGRFGRFFGLTHEDIERVGKKFTGKVWQDGALIFLLRAIPFFPSLAVSLACGVIKIELKTFVLASYLGNVVKDTLYIMMGYFCAQAFRTLLLEMERVRFGLGFLITVGVVGVLVLGYRQRHQGIHLLVRFWGWIRKLLAR
jgi:membrane protein DedA with SNARE-associated domain